MDAVFTALFYIVTAILLAVSLKKNKKNTHLAIKKAWKLFLTVLPQFAAISMLVGLVLAVVRPDAVQRMMGTQSGFGGMLFCALLGAAALIPVLVAFPIVAELLQNGAGLSQMAVFIATLTTVGIVSLPLEIRFLGKKAAILRNLLFFLFAIPTAILLEAILL